MTEALGAGTIVQGAIIRSNSNLMIEAGGMTHRYTWGNNEKRAMLKGKKCRMIVRGKMNSALVEFEDGQREVVSRNALRKE